MALDTMYAGKVNSPATTLDGGINDSVTTINVVDGTVLPDAPNLAVIGTGEDAETILYETKNGNELSDVTRGFQGVAKEWDDGTPVARLFTAYDYNTLKSNIADLDSRLGEANTASNIGGYEEIYKQKDGVDLEFRTLKAGTGIDLTWRTESAAGYWTTISGDEVSSAWNDNSTSPSNAYNGDTGDYAQDSANASSWFPDFVFTFSEQPITGVKIYASGATIYQSGFTHIVWSYWTGSAWEEIIDVDYSSYYVPGGSWDEFDFLTTVTTTKLKMEIYNGDMGSRYIRIHDAQIKHAATYTYYDYIEIDVDPSEVNIDDLGDIDITSIAKGDILYYDGDNWVNLGIGTEGQVLKVSSEGIPEWADIEELS